MCQKVGGGRLTLTVGGWLTLTVGAWSEFGLTNRRETALVGGEFSKMVTPLVLGRQGIKVR